MVQVNGIVEQRSDRKLELGDEIVWEDVTFEVKTDVTVILYKPA